MKKIKVIVKEKTLLELAESTEAKTEVERTYEHKIVLFL